MLSERIINTSEKVTHLKVTKFSVLYRWPKNYFVLIKLYFVAGVNLLIGTDNGLMLLDRSGQGKGWILCILSHSVGIWYK